MATSDSRILADSGAGLKKIMIKLLAKLILFNLPFLLIAAVMFYLGLTTNDRSLTSDGFNLKIFFYLMGAGFGGLSLLGCAGFLIFAFVKRKRIEQIVAHGKQGTAKILRLTDTGTRINDDPRVKMLLEISIPNYETYRAEKTFTVPMINLSQVQVGETVSVLADPEQPDNQKRIGLILK